MRRFAIFHGWSVVAATLVGVAFTRSTAFSAEPRPEDAVLVAPPIHAPPGPEYRDATRIFQGIPGLERAADGRLSATWYGGGVNEGPENYVMLATSGDDGKTWSKVKLVIDPPGEVRAFDPCLWHDPQGRLWLFWAQAYHFMNGPVCTWAIVTEDSGVANPVWSRPRRICDGIMMNKPIVLPDGQWLLPAALWHRDGSVRIVRSTDQGKTFELLSQINVPVAARQCDEPMLVQRDDNRLWALVRTAYGIGQSTSNDGGKTWSQLTPSSIQHTPSRFFMRRLASGNLLLVKHGPIDRRTGRSHLTAYLSRDDGATWKGGLLLDGREGVSYPDGVESPDGTIYIIYDYNRTNDKQILMATFTEADVAKGRVISDRARFRVLVNQATGKPTPVKP